MVEIPQKSKAALITEYNKPYEIREIEIPEIVPNAVLVKVEMAGVCGTDVHQVHGKLGMNPKLPVLPGHEVVGRIVKMGQGRTADIAGEPLAVGDRIMWPHVSCGKCFNCAINLQPNMCERRIGYGFNHVGDYPYLSGSFAEYEYVVPNADIIKIPNELSNEEVVGASCAFRTAVSAFERLGGGVGIQSSVVIQGCGPIGLYSTLLAVEGGASKIIVVGAPALRLNLAKKWGADYVINIDEMKDAAQRKAEIMKLTNGRGPDVVVEASGVPAAFREGMDIVRRGGRYLVIGQSSGVAEQSIIPGLLMLKHMEIIGNGSATIRHFYKALQFIKNKRNRYNFAEIITNHYPLDKAYEAIKAMEAGKEIKPVIVP